MSKLAGKMPFGFLKDIKYRPFFAHHGIHFSFSLHSSPTFSFPADKYPKVLTRLSLPMEGHQFDKSLN
jgi:hypothetical protein